MKDVIFPYFVDNNNFSTVLFIGSQWYTRGYNRVFKDKNYWTLEVDPEQAKYGSSNHIIDYAENVSDYFSKSAIDLIICNGVYGYGLDDKADFDRTIDGFNDCLRAGGIFIHGWNDIPEHRPFDLNDSVSLKRFSLFEFPPLSASHYLTANPNRHTYDFYAK